MEMVLCFLEGAQEGQWAGGVMATGIVEGKQDGKGAELERQVGEPAGRGGVQEPLEVLRVRQRRRRGIRLAFHLPRPQQSLQKLELHRRVRRISAR